MTKAIVFDCSGVFYLSPVKQFDPELTALVRRLRPQYKTGMLTNAQRSSIDRLLAEHDATDLFDAVLASSESQYMKPDREIFAEIAERLDVALPEMLFIDDWAGNTEAATRYGIRSIVYENPHQLEQELLKLEIHLS
jgi:putative hydrolase of the HAD superfamily